MLAVSPGEGSWSAWTLVTSWSSSLNWKGVEVSHSQDNKSCSVNCTVIWKLWKSCSMYLALACQSERQSLILILKDKVCVTKHLWRLVKFRHKTYLESEHTCALHSTSNSTAFPTCFVNYFATCGLFSSSDINTDGYTSQVDSNTFCVSAWCQRSHCVWMRLKGLWQLVNIWRAGDENWIATCQSQYIHGVKLCYLFYSKWNHDLQN